MKKGNYILLIIGVLAITFVLGMALQQGLDKKKYYGFVQQYSLNDGGYLVAKESYACVYGNSTEMERFYFNIVVPSLQQQPVCFVNNHKIDRGEVQNGTI